ncbi:YggT family protein [Raineyella fluvialis]|uniref:YggT family protein n=1 Tax=Raineyella fluvialis TaxID=2662261 RepID=A0A5Q2FB37_9ACTN|nr:YggT family protein [Raineyella fluvialis]QGF24240.1 YggT family protein [Raineyella fluvialis]
MLTTLGLVIHAVLWLFMALLFVRMVLSWVPVLAPQWRPRGLVLLVAETTFSITDPPLKWLGRFIRPVRMGNVAFDVSFMLLFFAVWLLMRLNATFLIAG